MLTNPFILVWGRGKSKSFLWITHVDQNIRTCVMCVFFFGGVFQLLERWSQEDHSLIAYWRIWRSPTSAPGRLCVIGLDIKITSVYPSLGLICQSNYCSNKNVYILSYGPKHAADEQCRSTVKETSDWNRVTVIYLAVVTAFISSHSLPKHNLNS